MKVILLFVLLIHVQLFSQDKFNIQGDIDSISEGTAVYLIGKVKKDTLSQSVVSNGAFFFHGHVEGGTQYYSLAFSDSSLQSRSKFFLLENGNLEILVRIKEWPYLHVSGSKSQDELNQIMGLWNKDDRLEENLERSKIFILAHPSSLYIADAILSLRSHWDANTIAELFKLLNPSAQQSFFGKKLQALVEENFKRYMEIRVGAIIPDFFIKTSRTDSVSIRKIAAKSKVTLLDFWASYCGPCKASFPFMDSVYRILKPKGFNIVSIMLDTERSFFLQQTSAPLFSWKNTWDERGVTDKIFAIGAIPAYILIDQKGKILSFDVPHSTIPPFGPPIKGEELYNTINNLLSDP